MFNRVLAKLSHDDREIVLKCWEVLNGGRPEIVIGTKEELEAKGVKCPASTRGAQYFFRQEIFEYAPDTVMDAIIAHELAHAYDALADLNQFSPSGPPSRQGFFDGPVERARNEIAEREKIQRIEEIANARVKKGALIHTRLRSGWRKSLGSGGS